MSRWIRVALLTAGLVAGLGVRAPHAQDLPRALHLVYDRMIETSEWTGRRQDLRPESEQVAGRRHLHMEFELRDLTVTPEGTRAQLAVSVCTAHRELGRKIDAKKEPVDLHLAGVTVQVFWGADGAFRVEKVVEGAPPPEEIKLIEEWNAETIFGRRRLVGRTLEAGEQWQPDVQPLLAEVERPTAAPPGVEDWKEADHPPQGKLEAKVERVQDGLAHVRWEGSAECERATSARVGTAAVSGNAFRLHMVRDVWVVDLKLRLPIFQRNERSMSVSRYAGDSYGRHFELRIDVWMLVP